MYLTTSINEIWKPVRESDDQIMSKETNVKSLPYTHLHFVFVIFFSLFMESYK